MYLYICTRILGLGPSRDASSFLVGTNVHLPCTSIPYLLILQGHFLSCICLHSQLLPVEIIHTAALYQQMEHFGLDMAVFPQFM